MKLSMYIGMYVFEGWKLRFQSTFDTVVLLAPCTVISSLLFFVVFTNSLQL